MTRVDPGYKAGLSNYLQRLFKQKNKTFSSGPGSLVSFTASPSLVMAELMLNFVFEAEVNCRPAAPLREIVYLKVYSPRFKPDLQSSLS